MSWFARSISNHLKLDDEDNQKVDDDQSPGQGVKEDLSEITRTLTRQLWGVASFLTPPLPNESSDPEAISGIRRDFAEIGGRFRTGISKLSNNIDVSEISKIASNFLQLESDDDDYDSTDGDGAVGVTDEVVAFAIDIAMHPETWLDFPLLDDDQDFELSDAQQKHALAVEHLAPRLAALRIELCPGYMNESSFWKIYFILVHPRLEHQAAQFLSTPNIVKARVSLTHELKNRSTAQSKKQGGLRSDESMIQENCSVSCSTNLDSEISAMETEKQLIHSDEIEIVDKSVIQEESHNEKPTECKDEDDWLKEENVMIIPIENDEDVSFSDLEDDDDNIPITFKKPTDSLLDIVDLDK